MLIAVMLVVGITAAAGDILIFRWSKSASSVDLLLSLGSWTISLVLFGLLLRWSGRTLGLTFIVAAVLHTLLILLWDVFAEKTRWTTLELVGIVVAVTGVIITEVGHTISTAEG